MQIQSPGFKGLYSVCLYKWGVLYPVMVYTDLRLKSFAQIEASTAISGTLVYLKLSLVPCHWSPRRQDTWPRESQMASHTCTEEMELTLDLSYTGRGGRTPGADMRRWVSL